MRTSYDRYVSLVVMWDPARQRWESWDTAVQPKVIGIGTTPHEALSELEEKLRKLGYMAPSWVILQERSKT